MPAPLSKTRPDGAPPYLQTPDLRYDVISIPILPAVRHPQRSSRVNHSPRPQPRQIPHRPVHTAPPGLVLKAQSILRVALGQRDQPVSVIPSASVKQWPSGCPEIRLPLR